MGESSTRKMSQAREALPQHVLFEKRDELYWLEGRDLDRVRKLLGLRCADDRAGFDRLMVSVLVEQLRCRHVKVGLVMESCIRTFRATRPVPIPQSETIQLPPETLFDARELRLPRRGLASGLAHEISPLYVYEVATDMYEVDWQLTPFTQHAVHALIQTAYQAQTTVTCQKLLPPSRRSRQPRSVVDLSLPYDAVTYGQLTLPWAN